jgi:hypothetical protein
LLSAVLMVVTVHETRQRFVRIVDTTDSVKIEHQGETLILLELLCSSQLSRYAVCSALLVLFRFAQHCLCCSVADLHSPDHIAPLFACQVLPSSVSAFMCCLPDLAVPIFEIGVALRKQGKHQRGMIVKICLGCGVLVS